MQTLEMKKIFLDKNLYFINIINKNYLMDI